MHKYRFTAYDKEKRRITSVFFAENESELRMNLVKQELYPMKIKLIGDTVRHRRGAVRTGARAGELGSFCRQLAVMCSAGMSVTDALGILRSQQFTGYLKAALFNVYEDIRTGETLSGAMTKHRNVFPSYFTAMISVGEHSGTLEEVLRSLAGHYESEDKIRKKLSDALAYPIMLVFMLFLVIILLLCLVIPNFRESMNTLGISELPESTRAVFAFSDFITENALTVLFGAAALACAVYLVMRTERVKLLTDKALISLPIIGRITSGVIALRFSESAGLLLKNGMDALSALEVTGPVIGNDYAVKQLSAAVSSLKKGKSLTAALNETHVFPQALIQLISVGEISGKLDEVLLSVCPHYDREVERMLMSFAAAVQPLMLVIMGAVIAITFMSVYAPIIGLMSSL